MAYAEYTKVPFDRSVAEMQSLLRKRGADSIVVGEEGDMFAIQFSLTDRRVRFRLSLVDERSTSRADIQRRQRARALLLVIKAKLESVDAGIETLEQAFLANVVTSTGETVHERMRETLELEYQEGRPSQYAGLLPPPEAR